MKQYGIALVLLGVMGMVRAEQQSMAHDAKIYIAGHHGLVGSALERLLRAQGYENIIGKTSNELDLRDQHAVDAFFAQEKPDYVFLAAAKVGGIYANNTYPAEFMYDNLMISANVIHAAYKHGVKKLLFLGSSCIYPRMCPQPIKEEYLMTDELEKTNEAYALAKIAGIKLCQSYNRQYGTNFISVMPTNLYGPYDNFHLENSHVIPALLAKVWEAKKVGKPAVSVWGSGKPYREFLYVEDLADAVIFLMNTYDGADIVNIGTGKDCRISELIETIKEVVGYEGAIEYDASKPDGTPRKRLNVDRLKDLGWEAKTSLKQGLRKTVDWCVQSGTFE